MILESIRGQHVERDNLHSSAHWAFSKVDQWLLQEIHQSAGRPPVRLALENSAAVSMPGAVPVATIRLRDRMTLLGLILDPDAGFGDAYAEGRIVVEGELVTALEALDRAACRSHSRNAYASILAKGLGYLQRNSLRGARKNIHRHYDLSNDFFQLWLDPQLVYSCAYFPSNALTLDEAQVAKMDYICRKLNLRPGERVLDIGSGWGALALHMARHYGVTVRGFGISREQVLWARRRAMEADLGDRVEFIEDDYRNVLGTYDALVSVGMLEHVGAEHFKDMGRIIDRSLGPSGRGLMHTIGRNSPRPFSTWITKRIFPGAYAPTLRETMDIFEPWDFSILDVENLRSHYARTLEHWLERFEGSVHQVSAMFGADFARMWRLYLAAAIAGFRTGSLQLFQIVFARTDCRQIPPTRIHLYREESRTSEATGD